MMMMMMMMSSRGQLLAELCHLGLQLTFLLCLKIRLLYFLLHLIPCGLQLHNLRLQFLSYTRQQQSTEKLRCEGISDEQYLCLTEFAIGVLLQRLQLLVLLLGFLQLVLQFTNLMLQLCHLFTSLPELRLGLLQGRLSPCGTSLELAFGLLLSLTRHTIHQCLHLHQLLLQDLHVLHSWSLQLGGRAEALPHTAPPQAPFLLLEQSIGLDVDCCSPVIPAEEKVFIRSLLLSSGAEILPTTCTGLESIIVKRLEWQL
ncbi:hypothetical protein INR49_021532 [Caranx melampygus]|nr:hypothetical protein INR49_021532 [Caranx melampygus]